MSTVEIINSGEQFSRKYVCFSEKVHCNAINGWSGLKIVSLLMCDDFACHQRNEIFEPCLARENAERPFSFG